MLRLVPWGTLSAILERTVRKTARALGKEARLQLVAPEIEVDKGVLSALTDPLIHVLRNAVDHGIEPQSQRLSKGKPATGLIRVSASFDNRGVTVLVEDDGAGIDLDALRRTMPRDAAGIEVTPAELLAQMFEPGRSTADHVSAISGRGVGLDLAKRRLEICGGTIAAVPRGKLGGATFRLWVPVDLSLGSALLVRGGGVFFSIGLEYVERILRLPATRVEQLSSGLLLQMEEGDPIALVRLDELMGTGKAALGHEITVVMLAEGGCRLPLLVDTVVDLRELLILPLPWGLNGLPTLRGGSVMPDGALALALAPPTVLLQKSQGTRASMGSAPISRGKRILVADDSHTARALAKSALLSAGYEVELAVDGLDAWNRLQRDDFLVLVTDVQMPNMDGFELTRRVRADARFARLPVVIVTTRSTREDIDCGLSVGADEYVVKGALQREQLIEAVGRHA
jgi:chemotaxis protein histidine kinase CheA